MSTIVTLIVGGLLTTLGNVSVQLTQTFTEGRKIRREQANAERTRKTQSDAACWRLVKRHLDELWWETVSATTETNGTTSVPIAEPLGEKWFEHWKSVAKISNGFILHDIEAQKTLKELQIVAGGILMSAGMTAFSSKNLDDSHLTAQLRAEMNQSVQQFRNLFHRVNETIRDSVGFDAVYAAPLISVQDLPAGSITAPDTNDYKF